MFEPSRIYLQHRLALYSAVLETGRSLRPLPWPAHRSFETPSEFARLQSSCALLREAPTNAAPGVVDQVRDDFTYKDITVNGLLYRKCISSRCLDKIGSPSLVVLRSCRPVVIPCALVISIAHTNPLTGHL